MVVTSLLSGTVQSDERCVLLALPPGARVHSAAPHRFPRGARSRSRQLRSASPHPLHSPPATRVEVWRSPGARARTPASRVVLYLVGLSCKTGPRDDSRSLGTLAPPRSLSVGNGVPRPPVAVTRLLRLSRLALEPQAHSERAALSASGL